MTGSLSTQAAFIAPLLLTIAGLIFAVLQWRQGLAEKALDSLYQRLALANQMRLEVFRGLDTDDEEEAARKREELYRLFVYTEFDSLEYAIRRYGSGLGSDPHAVEKSIRHFERRCSSKTFWRVADECAREGGYFHETLTVVKTILEQVQSRVDRGAIQGDSEEKATPS